MSGDHEHQQHRVISRLGAAAFSDATSSIIDTHGAVKTLAITVTLEVVAIVMFILAKEKVAEMIDNTGGDFWIYGSAVFFFNGLFIMFALYTLIADRWPHRRAGIFQWVFSFAAGALNTFVFFVLSAMALN